jgi:hypothetical protein
MGVHVPFVEEDAQLSRLWRAVEGFGFDLSRERGHFLSALL